MNTTNNAAVNLRDFEAQLAAFVETSPLNHLSDDIALRPDLVGLKLFDTPLVRVGSADDPLFEGLRAAEALGPQARMPHEWLEGAVSVVSYFLPASEEVRASNRTCGHASDEWLHARIDGQVFIGNVGRFVVDYFAQRGYAAICPAISPDFAVAYLDDKGPAMSFRSNWSERHVAFICGMGTFSLSRGLITEKGMAGRLGSVITCAPLPCSERPYQELDEYCVKCGACIPRCPVNAISLDSGKDHYRCYEEMIASRQLHPGYLGCGKCQVGVPCEFARP